MTRDGDAVADQFALTDPRVLKEVADIFISHAWSCAVEDVVRAVVAQCKIEGRDPQQTYVWLDWMVMSQRRTRPEEVCEFLPGIIRRIGRVFFVAIPWEHPSPLRRSWCLFELFCSCAARVDLIVVTELGETAGRAEALAKDFEDAVDAIAEVDITQAEASEPEDQEKILKLLENGPGVMLVNHALKAQLGACYAAMACGALRRLEGQGIVGTTEIADMAIWVGRLLQDLVGFEVVLREDATTLGFTTLTRTCMMTNSVGSRMQWTSCRKHWPCAVLFWATSMRMWPPHLTTSHRCSRTR